MGFGPFFQFAVHVSIAGRFLDCCEHAFGLSQRSFRTISCLGKNLL